VSVRRRRDRWVAVIYNPVLQRKEWVGTYDSRKEAKIAEADALKAIERGKLSRETCDGFAERWIESYPRQRESTNLVNAQRIKRFAEDFKGRRLASINRVEARAWALHNRSYVPTARAMYSDAVRDQLVDDNPFLGLRLEGSRGRRDLVVPTPEELGVLIQKAREVHKRYGALVFANYIQFAAYSGLRPGELSGLRWGDIDFRANTITVARQFNPKTRSFGQTKNGKTRVVFLSPQAKDALNATPRLREEVFTAPRGGLLSGAVTSVYFKPVASAAGRPELTPHCLRHYYGTYLANEGASPYVIAQALGHEDGGKLAMQTYIHLSEQDARDQIARIFGMHVQPLRLKEDAG
jgi:integrase